MYSEVIFPKHARHSYCGLFRKAKRSIFTEAAPQKSSPAAPRKGGGGEGRGVLFGTSGGPPKVKKEPYIHVVTHPILHR